jgi:2,4-diketo-3-deoxy-L-fuconate hydrolase
VNHNRVQGVVRWVGSRKLDAELGEAGVGSGRCGHGRERRRLRAVRLVNAGGRAALLVDGLVHDLTTLSGAALLGDPMAAIAHWDDVRRLAEIGTTAPGSAVDDAALRAPVPRPGAVFAVGINYHGHAKETGAEIPELPAIFTKYQPAINGPFGDVVLPPGEDTVDYEAELAFVIGRAGRDIAEADALDHVAGYLAAQDISCRRVQRAAGNQFSMGKSFDTFCPLGPAIVSLDEFSNPLDLGISCNVSGEVLQDARTSDLIRNVPALVAFLSSVLTLQPGDVCLTGTPAGVGVARTPPRFLQPGDVIVTEIEGVGALGNSCVRSGSDRTARSPDRPAPP